MDRRLSDREETEKVILHDAIWSMYDKLKNEPTITVDDAANLEYLFQEYTALGGNHRARIMYEHLKHKEVITEEAQHDNHE